MKLIFFGILMSMQVLAQHYSPRELVDSVMKAKKQDQSYGVQIFLHRSQTAQEQSCYLREVASALKECGADRDMYFASIGLHGLRGGVYTHCFSKEQFPYLINYELSGAYQIGGFDCACCESCPVVVFETAKHWELKLFRLYARALRALGCGRDE